MKRAGFLAVALAVAVLGTATAASASPAVPIVMSESMDFVRPPGEPAVGTFTLTGLGLCASGTSVDRLVSFNSDFTRIVIERRYTCADSAGGFSALQVLTLDDDPATQTESVSGTWVIRDGSGLLRGLQGAGRTEGVNVGCNPRCTSGESTVEAIAHLD